MDMNDIFSMFGDILADTAVSAALVAAVSVAAHRSGFTRVATFA